MLYRVELTEPDEDGVTPLDLEKCMKVRKYSQRMEMFPKDGNVPKGWKCSQRMEIFPKDGNNLTFAIFRLLELLQSE